MAHGQLFCASVLPVCLWHDAESFSLTVATLFYLGYKVFFSIITGIPALLLMSYSTSPHAGSGVVRMDPIRFLARCRTGFLCLFIVCRRMVRILCLYSAIMLMCVGCFGLVVSTCPVIGYRKTPMMTPS